MKKLLLFLLALTLLLGACTPTRETTEKTESEIQAEIENEEKPEELTVYVVGDKVVNKKLKENVVVKYSITSYSLGPYGPLTNAAREYGHMYYGPFENFEKETGIKLNVLFFGGMEEIESQILEDRIEGKGPDIIIADGAGWNIASNYNNIYRLIHNNQFIDLMPYLELDQVYTNGEYYNEVLNAGVLDDKQYVVPLCFNMNAIFTSKKDMEDIGVVIEEEMSSAEILTQLTQACTMADEGMLVFDNLSLWTVPTTFVQDYWESTGCPVVNYETGEVTVNRQVFEDVAECFKEYIHMNILDDWDTVLGKAEEYLNDSWWEGYITPGNLETLDANMNWFMRDREMGLERINQGVFFYENSTALVETHSLPGQCATLETIYSDLEENMVMIGVPLYERSDQYMAQVQRYGCVLTESNYPYHCYLLLKYLMDQEYDPYYVIPVNKINAETTLEKLSTTTQTLHLSLGGVWDYDTDFSLTKSTYDVQPLSENLKKQLQHMLNNIGGAVLPQASVYVPLLWHMEAYAFELETMDEAYENACADLEEHLQYIMAGDSDRNFNYAGYENFLLRGSE